MAFLERGLMRRFNTFAISAEYCALQGWNGKNNASGKHQQPPQNNNNPHEVTTTSNQQLIRKEQQPSGTHLQSISK